MKHLSASLLAFAFSTILSASVHAQVTWQTPATYTGANSDIKTNGTFVAAVTDNTVDGNNTLTVGDTVFDPGSDSHITGLFQGGSDGSHSTSTNYQEALDGCAYTFGPTISFTLTGLNANDEYQIEIWDVDASPSRETEYSSTGSAGTTTVDVQNGFVLGTFSGVTSETISYQPAVNGGAGEVNAVALRNLGVAPEPSTYAMMLGGLVLLRLCVRRNLALS